MSMGSGGSSSECRGYFMQAFRWTALILATCLASWAQDDVDHCVGLVWSKGGSFDLKPLVGPASLPPEILVGIHFHATENGSVGITDGNVLVGGVLPYGRRPGFPEPTIRLVTMCYGPQHQMLDRLWVVINSPETYREFATWCTNNASTTWATTLPKPYSSIRLSTNSVTKAVTPIDPEPGAPNLWSEPIAHSTYLHHDAVYEMRSATDTSSAHGHQATYDAQGRLIRSGIAAGTADFRRPYMSVFGSTETFPNWTYHLEQDVKPFIRALQLDGNPVVPKDHYQNLNRQCLYVGAFTEAYLALRPVTPSGVIEVE